MTDAPPPIAVRTSGVTFTRAGVVRGMRECVPLLIGVTPFGLVTGILAQAWGCRCWKRP